MAYLGELHPGSGTGIVGLWHLNGNSNDSSGNGYNGTDTAITYSLANGKFGQGAGFNGSSSFITINSQVLSTSATAFTVSAWIKSSSFPTSACIVCDRTGAVYPYNIFFRVDNGKLKNTFHDGNTLVNDVIGTTTVSTNLYHMVTLTWDSSNQKVYLDGVLDGSAANNYHYAGTTYPCIGRRQGPVVADYFSGNIDEVAIFSPALSASEIRKMYAVAKGRYL